jgi:hypothetical protein
MNCEAVGMCLQAGAVLNAETSDFLFNRRDLKVLSEDHGCPSVINSDKSKCNVRDNTYFNNMHTFTLKIL